MAIDRGARGNKRQRRAFQILGTGGFNFGAPLEYDRANQRLTIGLGNGLELDGSDDLQADLGDGLTFSSSDIVVAPGDGLALSGGLVVIDLATDPGLEFNGGDLRALVADPIIRDASGIGLNTTVPYWRKYTLAHTAWTAAAATEDVELFSLPAGAVIQAVKIKHTTAFASPTGTDHDITVGVAGNLAKYHSGFDVDQVVGDTVLSVESNIGVEDEGSAVSIRAALTIVGDNVADTTAGSVDVWVLWSDPG